MCVFFDDEWDPVDLHFGRKVYVAWGKPPNHKGETQGNTCYYCVKVFCALFRDVGNTTITTYQKSLTEAALK